MLYTIIDILDKIIGVEEKGREIYLQLAEESKDNVKLASVARILALEEQRHIEIYTNMKKKYQDAAPSIEFDVYDRVSKLIIDFFKTSYKLDSQNVNELLKAALSFENENLALIIAIRDFVGANGINGENTVYEILSSIIDEEQKHVSNLELFVV